MYITDLFPFNSEKAVLAVTLNNEKDEVLAHAAFFDYPNVADVDQAEWQEWMNTHFDYDKCTVSYVISTLTLTLGAKTEEKFSQMLSHPDPGSTPYLPHAKRSPPAACHDSQLLLRAVNLFWLITSSKTE